MDSIVKLTRRANLVQLEYGELFLEFGDRHFARDELVPYEILGAGTWPQSSIATMTAGDFVELCMREKFDDIEKWPALARDFVFPTYSHIFRRHSDTGRERR